MNTVGKKSIIRTIVFALCIMFSAVAVAHGGWGGGGWHGGGWHGGGWHGGGWHGGGWHGGGWHGGGWHGGGWHGGGWGGAGWYGGAFLLGAPLYYGYYGYGCQTTRVCNVYGNCWLQQSCY